MRAVNLSCQRLAVALAVALSTGCRLTPDPSAPVIVTAPPPPSSSASSSAGSPPTSPAAAAGCDAKLPADSVARLHMEGSGRDVGPGDRVELRLGHYTHPGAPMERSNACVTWSVDEAGMATIDAAQQTLTVQPGAKGTLHLRARVSGAGTVVAGELVIISRELAPLVGIWKEEARLDCKTRTWVTPPQPIRELHLRAEGKLLVTWTPFEVYYDYEAAFTWDPASGKMALQVKRVNYQPPDLRPTGTARIEKGALLFEGIWLGSARGQTETPACAHRFVR